MLPHVWSGVTLASHLGFVAFVSVVAPVVVTLASRRPASGHAAWGPAVWADLPAGRIVCARREWARDLSSAAGLGAPVPAARPAAVAPWAWLGAALAVGATFPIHKAFHPTLRVLNLTGERLWVSLDGRRVALVEATTGESPSAGAVLRVAAGQHDVSAVALDGRLLTQDRVVVESGKEHLYAPASVDRCFWVETRAYGREPSVGRRIRVLTGPPAFWAIPEDIDVWFAPAPGVGDPDARSSGGMLTAVRQARCEEAPPVVREHARDLRLPGGGGTKLGP